MSTLFQFAIRLTLMVCLVNAAVAQDNGPANTRKTSLTVTGSATGDRVRFTAPSSVVQIRLEVYDSTGKKLFDNEVRGGNVLDWQLRDGQAEHLADEIYLCAITVKSLAGKITKRIGSVTIVKGVGSVEAVDALQMTAQQTQAVGPLEENASLTVLKEGETQTATVIAHNGEEGQITRGRGALSFRMGDFYGGRDTEQMRLTPEGNLGIGITHPQARLDVDGLIRTSQGILFADGTIQTTAAGSASGGEAASGGTGLGIGKRFKGTNQVATSGTDGNGKKKFKPELFVNEDLTVNGNIIFTPSVQGMRDITVQNNNGALRFYGAPFPLTTSPAAAAIQFWGNNSLLPGQLYLDSGAHNLGAVIIRTTGTAGTIAERMRVTATGNVGIGTITPGYKLDVADRMRVRQGASNSAGIWFYQTTPANDRAFVGMVDDTNVGFWGNTGAGFGLSMDTTSGNVGIGTIAPGARLHVTTASGICVYGDSGDSIALYGHSAATFFNAAAVLGEAVASSDHVVGVYGKALIDPNGTGVAGFGQATGGYFSATGNVGTGVYGLGFYGVYGQGYQGVHGSSTSGASGVYGISTKGPGVHGVSQSSSPGMSDSGPGVRGDSDSGSGVEGNSNSGTGVAAFGGTTGIYATGTGNAGYFQGNVTITGNLNVQGSSKNFQIDHPLDPANKYLLHASIESSEVKNLYDGTALLDAHGEAVVKLPEWFEALNRDFRYQLTCIGGSAPIYIAEKIADHRFKIAGGRPGMEVSWQVTGNRQDPVARAYPMQVEQEKPTQERGHYLHPEVYGQPVEKGVEWALRPQMKRQLKEPREKLKAP